MQFTVKKSLVKPEFTEFEAIEWKEMDLQYYGRPTDWSEQHIVITAQDKQEDVGSIRISITMGVCYIEALIVGNTHRRKGIGSKLIKKAEDMAKELGAHQMTLDTGKLWGTIKFYESHGYKITADLPNHYYHIDFVLMTKFFEK